MNHKRFSLRTPSRSPSCAAAVRVRAGAARRAHHHPSVRTAGVIPSCALPYDAH